MLVSNSSSDKIKSKGAYALVILHGVAASFAFGIPLPTLNTFVTGSSSIIDNNFRGLNQSTTFYSATVGLFSIGELFCCITLPILFKRFPKLTFSFWLFILNIFGMIGGVIYATTQSTQAWTLLLSRFLVGIWSGGINLSGRLIIPILCPTSVLTSYMSILGFFMAITMAISPGFASLLTSSDPLWNQLRNPGWATSLFAFFCCTMLCILHSKLDFNQLTENQKNYQTLPSTNDNATPPPVSVSLILQSISVFFVSSFGFTMLESMLAPVATDTLALSIESSSMLFLVAGSISAGGFFIAFLFSSKWMPEYIRFTDFFLSILSMTMMLIGSLLFVDWHGFANSSVCKSFTCSYTLGDTCSWTNSTMCTSVTSETCSWSPNNCESCPPVCLNQSYSVSLTILYVSFCFMNMSAIFGRISSAASFSKMIQFQDSVKKSRLQSMLVMSGTLARVLGPVVSIQIYLANSRRTFGVGFLLVSQTCICLCMFIMNRKTK